MELRRRLARSEFKWRFVDNLQPTLKYRIHRSRPMSTEQRRLVATLRSEGVAVTNVTALLGDAALLDEMMGVAGQLEQRDASEIEAARRAVRRDGEDKAFIRSLVSRPTLDPSHIFVRFALDPAVLDVVNAYLGLFARLRYYDVWHTLTSEGRPQSSQLWHRDWEDPWSLVKVFMYLSDVDDGAGPFCFVPGTHGRGRIKTQARALPGDGPKRVTDAAMAEVVPPDRWVSATGPPGTVVFADTRGYHKGGYATERDRLMYTCMFTSAAVSDEVRRLADRVTPALVPAELPVVAALSSH